jgi:hypothetical protein
MGYRLDAAVLLLHTVQPLSAVDELRETGRLTPRRALEEPDYSDAYNWMRAEMAVRLPTAGESALWCWAEISRTILIHACRHSEPGDVLLTCRIPAERVLPLAIRPAGQCSACWRGSRGVGPVGLEPTTHGLKVRCSTN